MSDLHLDLFPLWQRVLDDDVIKYSKDVDVLVVPGDTAELNAYEWVGGFKHLAPHYPTILTVLGNHEHYYSDDGIVRDAIAQLPPNVKVLRREVVEVENIIFGGTTMWYPRTYSKRDREGFEEFQAVPGGEKWILEENDRDMVFLKNLKADVVITHHAPSMMSVQPRFIGSSLNAFFVCNMEPLILERSFKFWFHGHMHRAVSYRIGETQVEAAPRGYRGDIGYYRPKILSIKKYNFKDTVVTLKKPLE